MRTIRFPFKMRAYQIEVAAKLFHHKYAMFYLLWSARSGKDLTSFYCLVVSALRAPGGVFGYFFPTKEMARRIVFDGRLDDGRKMIDILPSDQIKQIDRAKMQISLINGAKIQFLCSDRNHGDSAAGETWQGAVISEFALMQHGDELLKVIVPRLSKKNGFLIINTTPRGALGTGYETWQKAVQSETWLTSKVKMSDIYKQTFIDEYIKKYDMDSFTVKRELECDFHAPIEQSILGHLIPDFEFVDEISLFKEKTFIGMDLGFKRDATSWWAFSLINDEYIFYDFAIIQKGQLDHILDDILQKYPLAIFFLPHDTDRGGGCAVIDRFRERGLIVYAIPQTISVEDDIKSMVKPFLSCYKPKFKACKSIKTGLEYLKMYRRNANTGTIYHGTDGASDAADAFRYAVCGIYQFLSC